MYLQVINSLIISIMKKLLTALFTVLFFAGMAYSQNQIPLIGSKAPSFKANSTNGVLTFPNDFGKDWKILFSHPQDFTPVCTTELLELAYMQSEFENLGVKVAVISTDNVTRHNDWKNNLEEIDFNNHGLQTIQFPIFEDLKGIASAKYGMIHESPGTVRDIRGVYIIDSKNIVRSINFYPIEIGRNMNEIVRIIEALKVTEEQYVFTPVNWNKGDDVIITYRPYTVEQYNSDPKKYNDKY
jgi:peroxiredoxin 2/4